MSDPPTSAVALRLRRDRCIEKLCEHFAQDHLQAEELEQLIDQAHRATSLAELDALLADLPGLAASSAVAPTSPSPSSSFFAPTGRDRDVDTIAAIMGGAERKGSWRPARQTSVLAVMGGVCLDFREATLQPGLTELTVLAMMGGVEIVVPPGIHVESSGVGIMGGFEHSGSGRFPVDSSVPVLRVTGLAFMGGVEIRQRRPGELAESGGERPAELRGKRRETRRELRDELRRLGRGEPRDGSDWPRRDP